MRDVELVAIVGAGPEACRLARAAALAGCSVRLQADDPAALDGAQERIRAAIEAGLAAGRLAPADRQRALDGILATCDLDEAVTHADLVVEAAGCTDEQRRAFFLRLGQACRASALVATGQSEPAELIDWLPQPGRLLGLRLPAADLGPGSALEVVPTVETSPDALQMARRFARRVQPGAPPEQRERLPG